MSLPETLRLEAIEEEYKNSRRDIECLTLELNYEKEKNKRIGILNRIFEKIDTHLWFIPYAFINLRLKKDSKLYQQFGVSEMMIRVVGHNGIVSTIYGLFPQLPLEDMVFHPLIRDGFGFYDIKSLLEKLEKLEAYDRHVNDEDIPPEYLLVKCPPKFKEVSRLVKLDQERVSVVKRLNGNDYCQELRIDDERASICMYCHEIAHKVCVRGITPPIVIPSPKTIETYDLLGRSFEDQQVICEHCDIRKSYLRREETKILREKKLLERKYEELNQAKARFPSFFSKMPREECEKSSQEEPDYTLLTKVEKDGNTKFSLTIELNEVQICKCCTLVFQKNNPNDGYLLKQSTLDKFGIRKIKKQLNPQLFLCHQCIEIESLLEQTGRLHKQRKQLDRNFLRLKREKEKYFSEDLEK